MDNEHLWGLTACGFSGGTSVQINEALSGETCYEIEISRPSWSLRCRIDSLKMVSRLREFLTNSRETNLLLGSMSQSPVEFLRDKEFLDRFFIVVSDEVSAIHFTISGANKIGELIESLEQISKDL